MNTDPRMNLAFALFDIGAVKFGSFKLKLHEKNPDAPLSPIYIDLRILRSFPEAMDLAVSVYEKLTNGIKFDMYADVPTAATPIVAVLSHKTRIPMISPRKDEKTHGLKRPIDGTYYPGQIALLVDDLITSAESKMEAISVLEENGLVVHDVVVLIDREQGGINELMKHGYTCHVGLTLREILKSYLEFGKIDRDQYKNTIAYIT